MLRIVRETSLTKPLLKYIERNTPFHVFLAVDLSSDPEETEVFLALSPEPVGYLLHYMSGMDSWVLEADSSKVAECLLERVRFGERSSLLASSQYADLILSRLEIGEHAPLYIMVVDRESARLVDYGGVRILKEEDSDELNRIYSEWKYPVDAKTVLEKSRVFGFYLDDRIVSVARLQSSGTASVILGVYTMRRYRRRGFASKVVSAATDEGLRTSNLVAMYVNEENEAAVNLYKKLGYRVYGERILFRS